MNSIYQAGDHQCACCGSRWPRARTRSFRCFGARSFPCVVWDDLSCGAGMPSSLWQVSTTTTTTGRAALWESFSCPVLLVELTSSGARGNCATGGSAVSLCNLVAQSGRPPHHSPFVHQYRRRQTRSHEDLRLSCRPTFPVLDHVPRPRRGANTVYRVSLLGEVFPLLAGEQALEVFGSVGRASDFGHTSPRMADGISGGSYNPGREASDG